MGRRAPDVLRALHGVARALLGLALLTATMPLTVPATVSAEEAPVESAVIPTSLSEPTSSGRASVEVVTTYVEDPTRMAGGEDDAVRAYERHEERRQDDDGDDRRRK